MSHREDNIFRRVLFIGTDRQMAGGVAAVLKSYERNIDGFKHLATNSRHGKLAAMANFALTLACIPFYRWIGGRDIIHVHGSSYISFTRKSMVIRWAKILGFKIVYHIHGGAFKEFTAERGENVIRRTLDRCDAIICLSDYWHEYFAGQLGYDNVHVVPNMIDNPTDLKIERTDSRVNCIFMGTICADKGIYDLVKVIADDQEYYRSRARFIIGGVGENDRLDEMIADYGIGDLVEQRGWIAGNDKIQLFNQADVLLLPSYIEGLPICILEAMSYGLPVLTTDVGAIPDVITHGVNGLIAKPGDLNTLNDNLHRVIEDIALRDRASQISRERVGKFLPTGIISSLKTIYKNL